MICDKYKNALLQAAASNGELDTRLARHLEDCSTCRKTLSSKKELFSRIDSALRAQANEDPSPDFFAQVRLQLSKETAKVEPDWVWQMAGAVLALVLIATFYPLVNGRQSRTQGNLQIPATQVPGSGGVTQFAWTRGDSGVRPRHHPMRPAQRAVQREPEVLVPPDERQAFAQFVACVARRDALAQAVVTPAANRTVSRKTELPEVSIVDIADLELDQGASGRVDQSR